MFDMSEGVNTFIVTAYLLFMSADMDSAKDTEL